VRRWITSARCQLVSAADTYPRASAGARTLSELLFLFFLVVRDPAKSRPTGRCRRPTADTWGQPAETFNQRRLMTPTPWPSISEYVRAQRCPKCRANPGDVCRSRVTKAALHGHIARQEAGAQRYSRDVIDDY